MKGYMSGASTEPELKMISAPRRSSRRIKGTSHHFFSWRRKWRNSLNNGHMPAARLGSAARVGKRNAVAVAHRLPRIRPGAPARSAIFLPAGALVAEIENSRLKDLGQNLQRFDQARTGTIEILVAVGQEDAPIRRGPQLPPIGPPGQGGHFGAGPGEVEAARHDDDVFGIMLAHGFPVEPGRMFAGFAE